MAAEPPTALQAARRWLQGEAVEFVIDASAGTVGGVIGVVTGSPFDVVKTRMQAGGAVYASTLASVRATLSREGPRAFFKGALVASLGQAPNNFLVFGTYGAALRALESQPWWRSPLLVPRKPGEHTALALYLAGTWAGFAQSIALAPFEHVKVQQQLMAAAAAPTRGTAGSIVATAPAADLGMVATARSIVSRLGVAGLMRGWVATMLRDAPTFGFYFLSYEATKQAYDRYGRPAAAAPVAVPAASHVDVAPCGDGEAGGVDEFCDYVRDHVAMAEGAPAPADGGGESAGRVTAAPAAIVASPPPTPAAELHYPVWVHLLGGGIAGVTSWSLALPADVIKSNVQGSALDTPRQQLRFATVAARLYKEHGVSVFFRGLAPCLLRAIPVNAITFLVYDAVLRRLREARVAMATRLA